jgi:hypothetical protein
VAERWITVAGRKVPIDALPGGRSRGETMVADSDARGSGEVDRELERLSEKIEGIEADLSGAADEAGTRKHPRAGNATRALDLLRQARAALEVGE